MNSELQFIEAVKAGDAAMVRQLIETDIFLADAKSEDGTSALLTAIYYGREEIARLILDSAPTLTVHEAAAAGLLDQLEDILDESPELINDFSHDGWTPLHLAVYFNRGDVAEYLIATGADVKAVSRNDLGVTPLHSALANRNTPLAKILLRKGADPHGRQAGGGYTPLHYAAANGLTEMAGLLLERGVDISIETSDGRTAHALAVEKGHSAVADLLSGSTSAA
jgi:ankyrin repeat protein